MTAIALLGSGEFSPWARPVDEWCARNATAASDRALVVPAASAPEGEDVFRRWASMGIDHYAAIGLTPEVVEIHERADASNAAIVDRVADARLIFFSGGNPGYLAETLRDTPFWEAVRAAAASGTAIGGCSAGAVFLGTSAPFVGAHGLERWVAGLGLLSRAYFMPHFDALDSYVAGLRAMMLRARPEGSVAVGIDEDTAMYGDGDAWSIAGAGAVWIAESGDEPVRHAPGEALSMPLGLTLG
jgi:cyanophycinase